MKNTLNVSPELWQQIKEIENPDAPTFEEFYNSLKKDFNKDYGNKYDKALEESIDTIACEYRGHLKSFNAGRINKDQFLTAKVWSTAAGLITFEF